MSVLFRSLWSFLFSSLHVVNRGGIIEGALTIALAICSKSLLAFCFPQTSLERGSAKTYSLARSIDLGGVTTTGNPDADVDVGELIGAQDEDRLVELRPEDLGGEQLERLAVHTDEALAGDAARHGCNEKKLSARDHFRLNRDRLRHRVHTGGILLLAEHLNCLGRHFVLVLAR